jgi:hypothetical protein
VAADKPQPAKAPRPQCPVHPLFFAAHPVLFLYAKTEGGFMFGEVLRPLALSVGFALVALGLLRVTSKNFQRAAIALTVFLLFFFSYSRIGDAVHHLANINTSIVWGAVLIAVIVLAMRGRYNADAATGAFNFAGAVLVAVVLFQIHTSSATGKQAIAALPHQQESKVSAPAAGQLPDVYYIILDGYGRADILKDIYNQDVSDFNGYLTRKGFYVAPRARSNYAQTMLSLSSSLNMEYLDFLDKSPGEKSRVRLPLFALLRDSEVCRLFRSAGYTIVDLPSAFVGRRQINADVYVAGRGEAESFELLLSGTTPIRAVFAKAKLPKAIRRRLDPSEIDRNRTLAQLADLGLKPEDRSPKFVFAHIMCPHPPFVFNRTGGKGLRMDWGFGDGVSSAQADDYRAAYREQVLFINSRMPAIIDRILASSKRPPVIVIQGDHGPGSRLDFEDAAKTDLRERLSILNAYYLPGVPAGRVYPTITPVNTFRVILNTYLGANFKLLPDNSFFSCWSTPYKFVPYTPAAGQ